MNTAPVASHDPSRRPPAILRYAAFVDEGRGGNRAGVVLDAESLNEAQMLVIAQAVGYSETAFVTAGTGRDQYDVRYFSPVAEVAFCGHATVALAVALAERGSTGSTVLSTPAGTVGVRTAHTPDGIAATLTSVPSHTRPASTNELSGALRAFGWEAGVLDPDYPPHVAYAGNEHLLLAVSTRDLLAGLDYDYPRLLRLMTEQGWTTVHVFWAEGPTLFHARDPFPPGGVVEDPATGAAAAAFGGYLRSLKLVEVPGQVTVLQGEDMGSPSRLLIDLAKDDDTVRVTGIAQALPDPDAP